MSVVATVAGMAVAVCALCLSLFPHTQYVSHAAYV